MLGADEIILNMGPQHPSTHGVLRVKLKLDGERVAASECIIGYLHRGVEKIAEHRSYQQFATYVDRMDYVAAVSNGLGYCEAMEKLLRRLRRAASPRSAYDPNGAAANCEPFGLAGNACPRYRCAHFALRICSASAKSFSKFSESYCVAR